MPASDAQVLANRKNALKSTGPKTPEGKAASRGNALTHGLTATKVFPEREAAEVERRETAFILELNPSGEVGEALARHAARMSVRLERCAEHETRLLVEHVKKALDAFEVPEAITEPAEIARLRSDVERRALFDLSEEAKLARKYEATAERGFFRALKELRQHEAKVSAIHVAQVEAQLASISTGDLTDDELVALQSHATTGPAQARFRAARSAEKPAPGNRADQLTVGKSPG